MTEALHRSSRTDKKGIYIELLPQIEAVLTATRDLIANMANVAAILKEAFHFHWVGFYRSAEKNTLVLAPFQGPLACVTIPFSKGVCGCAATTQKTIIVSDVNRFDGHIACSSQTKSEIVVPYAPNGETVFVLDIDSTMLGAFDNTDQEYLEKIVALVGKYSDIPS